MSAQVVQEAMVAWTNGHTVGTIMQMFPELPRATIFGITGVWRTHPGVSAETIWDATHNLPDDTRTRVIQDAVLGLHAAKQ